MRDFRIGKLLIAVALAFGFMPRAWAVDVQGGVVGEGTN